MPSTDPLDAADFNPTAHINRLFPNEESLAEVGASPYISPISRYISLYLAISRYISVGRLASAACTMAAWLKRPYAMLAR